MDTEHKNGRNYSKSPAAVWLAEWILSIRIWLVNWLDSIGYNIFPYPHSLTYVKSAEELEKCIIFW